MSDGHRAESIQELLLGIDIGGTKILGGLVNRSGLVVKRRQGATRPDHVLPDTIGICRDLIDDARRIGRDIGGIGVGAKGAVDSRRGLLVGSLYLGQGEIPIAHELSRSFGLPVRVENDVHAATIGEMMFGIGRTFDDFIFYNAGTGMAIGIVVGGQLYRGASNTAGENGHAPIDHGASWPCPCGLSGCVETMIVGGRAGRVLPRLSGFETAGEARDMRSYAYVGSNLLDMMALFDPSAVVVAGGMLNGGNDGTDWMLKRIALLCASMNKSEPSIYQPFAGRDAGLVGAASLLMTKDVASR